VAETPIRVKDGAKEVLQHLQKAGVPRAVATSTARATALRKLSAVGLLDTFDVVVGGDDVHQGKPEPDIYLAAADRLSVPANQCLALEDSENGVRSAHAAGMTVIHIPDLAELSVEVQRLGIRTLPSLRHVHHEVKVGILQFSPHPARETRNWDRFEN
jgi:beta-phosphoglucomutase-like phosphatase (HAD superfamily)